MELKFSGTKSFSLKIFELKLSIALSAARALVVF